MELKDPSGTSRSYQVARLLLLCRRPCHAAGVREAQASHDYQARQWARAAIRRIQRTHAIANSN